jgi:uncharacterized protein (DUF58 family)
MPLPPPPIPADKPQWALSPEGKWWLIASVGLFAVGWWKGINLILILSYTMLALTAVNAYGAWLGLKKPPAPARGLQGRRADGGLVFAGGHAQRSVEVEHDWPKAMLGWWVEEEAGPGGGTAVWPVGRLDPDLPLRLSRCVAAPRRGRYSLGPLVAGCAWPFGLVQWRRALAGPGELIVLPRMGRLHVSRLQQWLVRATREDGRAKPVPQRHPTRDAVIHGLRPFRLGDSPRLIHWRTSARRNELMVREFETPMPKHELLLVIEPWQSSDAAVEAAVSLAATVCWEWCRQPRNRLALVVAAPQPEVVPSGTGREHGRRLLEALAGVTGSPQTDTAGVAAAAASAHVPHDVPVLLVTSYRGTPLVEGLTAALGRKVAVIDATAPPDFYSGTGGLEWRPDQGCGAGAERGEGTPANGQRTTDN